MDFSPPMAISHCFKKNALYLSVNVFSTKVLTGDTIFTSGDGTAFLRDHPSHAKVSPLAVQTEYLKLFLSYLKTLSIGPAPGIKPATSHYAVKPGADPGF